MKDFDTISNAIIAYIKNYFATVGIAISTVISYISYKSIAWAVVHGLFSWGYVLYYLIKNSYA